MNRRDFIKQSTKITGAGLISASLLGCNKFEDFVPDRYQPLYNGITWSNFRMVVNVGVEGTNDTLTVAAPCVIKDGNLYKMWYEGTSGAAYRVFYCESDDGKTWYNHRIVVDVAASGTGWDTGGCSDPFVIKDGSTYKMWYSGGSAGGIRIIYAESTNGIAWTNFQQAVSFGSETNYGWDSNNAIGPCVIKEGSQYWMWYTGSNGTFNRTVFCKSDDGINWHTFRSSVDVSSQGTYDTANVFAPHVIKDGTVYKMWYTGRDASSVDRIIYCESYNGRNWQNFQLSVDIGSQGSYDSGSVYYSSVLNENGVGKMWYAGNDGTNWRILYAESR